MEVSRKFTTGDVYLLAGQSGFLVDSAWRSKKYGIQVS